jgi:SAM-dependent methyltransferase
MGWLSKRRRERGRRTLERQLEYQEKKGRQLGETDELMPRVFIRSQHVRQVIEEIRPIADSDAVLEVGSGAHGLIFGFGTKMRIGIDPLAVDYKRIFPKLQSAAITAAAIGEELPFADASFDVVLSDNVIDHAERPLKIIDEIARVLKPGGILYFTVNVHHPIYHLASLAHGLWNAAGLRVELSAFADHTVHLTEARIRSVIAGQPFRIIKQASNVSETRYAQRRSSSRNLDALLKKLFYKNALYTLIAVKD